MQTGRHFPGFLARASTFATLTTINKISNIVGGDTQLRLLKIRPSEAHPILGAIVANLLTVGKTADRANVSWSLRKLFVSDHRKTETLRMQLPFFM